LAILNHFFLWPIICPPDRLANTTSPVLGWDWITMGGTHKPRTSYQQLISSGD
jgi:hypothetical protein